MRDGHLEASGHNWVEGQGSGPRIDKKDGEEEDHYDAMGNKIDAKKAKKLTSAEARKLKKERMAQMMAGFDLGDDMSSTSELHIRATLQQLDSLTEIADSGEAVPSQELKRLRERLLDTQGLVRQAEYSSNGAANGVDFE